MYNQRLKQEISNKLPQNYKEKNEIVIKSLTEVAQVQFQQGKTKQKGKPCNGCFNEDCKNFQKEECKCTRGKQTKAS
jgi:hypothetical protein